MKNKIKFLKALLQHRLLRKIGLFCGVFVVALAVVAISLDKPSLSDKGEVKEQPMIRPVTVHALKPETYSARIVGYGEVNPEWKVDVRSKAQGEIIHISDTFRIGNKVEKGEILLRLDPTESEVSLAEAEFNLNQAKVDLLIEEKESKEALDSWQRSGLGQAPTSPLVLREPYLAMAKANLKVAEAALLQAQKQLNYTTIRAPFDALIVSRNVSLGGELFEGDEVCSLIGIQKSVIEIHIDKHQWEHFPNQWEGSEVDVVDQELKQLWKGILVREGQHFDPETRLRKLFVEVENPLDFEHPLFPGNFVEARFRGRPVDGLLKIPSSARNQKGFIWLVEEGNLLRSYAVVPEFQYDGFLFVKNPVEDEAIVVVNPNNSFVNGLQVTPNKKGS